MMTYNHIRPNSSKIIKPTIPADKSLQIKVSRIALFIGIDSIAFSKEEMLQSAEKANNQKTKKNN